MHDLGTLGGLNSFPASINASGAIVGYSNTATGESDAFLYDNGTMQNLGTLGGSYSYATAINNNGQIVGDAATASGDEHVFLYTNGTVQDLNSLIAPSSGWVLDQATGINDAGQIVGNGMFNRQNHAFLYSNGTVQDLGTLQGDTNSNSIGINSNGEILAESYSFGGNYHAFSNTSGVIQILGTLGGANSFGGAINDHGQIVGASDIAAGDSTGTQNAFLYSDGTMQDLNSLVNAKLVLQR